MSDVYQKLRHAEPAKFGEEKKDSIEPGPITTIMEANSR